MWVSVLCCFSYLFVLLCAVCCCVFCVVVCCVVVLLLLLLCVCGGCVQGPSAGPPSAGPPSPDPPPPDRPKFRSFFSLSRQSFYSFLPLFWSFSLNFGGVFEDRNPQMCTFGLSGCRVKPRRPHQVCRLSVCCARTCRVTQAQRASKCFERISAVSPCANSSSKKNDQADEQHQQRILMTSSFKAAHPNGTVGTVITNLPNVVFEENPDAFQRREHHIQRSTSARVQPFKSQPLNP